MNESIVKQLILIRKDLKMTRGKEIAQGAHASMACLLNLIRSQNNGHVLNPLEDNDKTIYHSSFIIDNPAIYEWIEGNFRKIVVSVNSEEELLYYYNLALEKKIISSLIEDSGFTMFNGIKTKTAVAIGPAYDYDIDPITRNLKLY